MLPSKIKPLEVVTMKKFVCTYANASGKLTIGKEYQIRKHIMSDCYSIIDNNGNVLLVTKKNGYAV